MKKTSRDLLVDSLRKAVGAPSRGLPPLTGPWIDYPDLATQFEDALRGARGKLLIANGALETAIAALDICKFATRIVSELPGLADQATRPSSLKCPQEAAEVDVAVVRAEFGVAENGAVWVSDRGLPQRSVLFLAEHLVLVLDPFRLVSNMHQAYRAIELQSTCFGCFISGPSKTADIEQALVVGAHGPRSLTVVARGLGGEQPPTANQ